MNKHWGSDFNWYRDDRPEFVSPNDDVLVIDPAASHRHKAHEIEWGVVKAFCLLANHGVYHRWVEPEAIGDSVEGGDEITLMNEHGRISLHLDGNTTTGDAVAMYCQMLMGLTYGQQAIIDALREVAEELES